MAKDVHIAMFYGTYFKWKPPTSRRALNRSKTLFGVEIAISFPERDILQAELTNILTTASIYPPTV